MKLFIYICIEYSHLTSTISNTEHLQIHLQMFRLSTLDTFNYLVYSKFIFPRRNSIVAFTLIGASDMEKRTIANELDILR